MTFKDCSTFEFQWSTFKKNSLFIPIIYHRNFYSQEAKTFKFLYLMQKPFIKKKKYIYQYSKPYNIPFSNVQCKHIVQFFVYIPAGRPCSNIFWVLAVVPEGIFILYLPSCSGKTLRDLGTGTSSCNRVLTGILTTLLISLGDSAKR